MLILRQPGPDLYRFLAEYWGGPLNMKLIDSSVICLKGIGELSLVEKHIQT
jgi:hypothetical protein